ncbi:MAG: glutamine-hydrolyzing carbamoyl-phosphate synthase small subunit [Nitrospirae bacterium]|nr:glutamine-hydrolyzing carbamoyl-phosphate synthase small subunit [Nitrospirota bacterium]
MGVEKKGSKALLVLADGTVFEGRNFGFKGETIGEVVFNTSMTGYQEIITDPSYKGQIVVMTYTQIGNYGINDKDVESKQPNVEGFVVKEYLNYNSSWRSKGNLNDYLRENRITGLSGLDTRALTSHLRDNGVQMGIISAVDLIPESLLEKVRKHPGISAADLVKEVTAEKSYKWMEGVWKPAYEKVRSQESGVRSKNSEPRTLTPNPPKVVVYDFGVKFNILRNLISAGFEVTVVPAQTLAEAALEMNPDGILLSNGPGDPQTVTYAVGNARKLLGKKPVFGICLGHQILGLAMGGRTYKLKFGHHGGNHPVMDLATEKVEITSQNHNYCVDIKTLKGQVELTHKNLYDGTEEGMKHVELPVFSVQYHPEAGPGPNDSVYLFRRFRDMLNS